MIKSKRQNKNRDHGDKDFHHKIAKAATNHIENAMQKEFVEREQEQERTPDEEIALQLIKQGRIMMKAVIKVS